MTDKSAVPAQKRNITRAEFAASLGSIHRRIGRAIEHARCDLGEIGTGSTLAIVQAKLAEAGRELEQAIKQFEARRQARRIARREAGEQLRRAKAARRLA